MAEPGPFGPGSAGFVGGLVGGIGLCCRRRGTFPAREKYPKARFSVGHGLRVELSLRWRPRSGRESADTTVLAETILHFMPLARNLQTCGTHPNNLKRAGRVKGFLNRRSKRRFMHTFCRCWQKVCHQRHNAPIPLPSYQKQTKNRRGLIAAPIFILSLPAFWSCRSAEESSSSHAHTRSGRAARDTRCSLSDRRAPT